MCLITRLLCAFHVSQTGYISKAILDDFTLITHIFTSHLRQQVIISYNNSRFYAEDRRVHQIDSII